MIKDSWPFSSPLALTGGQYCQHRCSSLCSVCSSISLWHTHTHTHTHTQHHPHHHHCCSVAANPNIMVGDPREDREMLLPMLWGCTHTQNVNNNDSAPLSVSCASLTCTRWIVCERWSTEELLWVLVFSLFFFFLHMTEIKHLRWPPTSHIYEALCSPARGLVTGIVPIRR